MCPPQVLEGHNEVSLEPSLLQANQAQFPQTFFTGEVLQPSDRPSGPPLDLFEQLHVPPVLGAPGLDAVLQTGPHEGRADWDNPALPSCSPSADAVGPSKLQARTADSQQAPCPDTFVAVSIETCPLSRFLLHLGEWGFPANKVHWRNSCRLHKDEPEKSLQPT